jgi:hypothetical protein
MRLAPHLLVLLAGAAFAQQNPPPLHQAAQRAYLYAYPLVLMDATREATAPVPGSDFNHLRQFPDHAFRQIVRPNADTLYSTGWLDLSKEPVMMHVPDTHGRYYLMQLLDAWTETISGPGKRTTGTGEGWFALVGPDTKEDVKLPEHARRIDCPTNMVWVLGRIQTNSATDYANVHRLQAGFHLMPLSRYPDGVRRALGSAATRPASATTPPPPPARVANMSTSEFFNRFAQLLTANPPHQDDGPMVKALAELGIRAGERFPATSQDPAFEAGVQTAKELLAKAETLRGEGQRGPTGWSGGTANVGRYGTNYLARAVVARIGLGANPPEDAVYLNCNRDSTGAPLDASKRYRMHFDKSRLPPVDAFWSVTMYDGQGYFVNNPIGRYAIGDRDQVRYNQDGSLDLFIQTGKPANPDNWLPAAKPPAPIVLSFRLYWPREEILKGKWNPPPVVVVAAGQ